MSEWYRRLGIPLLFATPVSLIAVSYIGRQHRRFLERSRPLSESQRARLSPFFSSTTLNTARLAKDFVPAPPLYRMIRRLGLRNMPDLSAIAGIMFMDIIVHSERLSDALLFHELVHVVQYEVLGLRRFAGYYVRGFLTSGSYDDIPLERQAYSLGHRFEQRPREGFSVLEEVREWQANGRF